jgi:hypothetical protein
MEVNLTARSGASDQESGAQFAEEIPVASGATRSGERGRTQRTLREVAIQKLDDLAIQMV